MEEQYEEARKKIMGIFDKVKDITEFLKNDEIRPIHFSEINEIERFDVAVDYLADIQKRGFYRGQKIGVIDPNLPKCFETNSLRRNNVIIYDKPEGEYTSIESPFIFNGSFCSSVTVNVPLSHIREIIF